MKILIILLALFSVSAQADPWRTSDTYREAAFMALHFVDYGQTLTVAENPQKYKESSSDWAMGTHPTSQDVTNYFFMVTIVHPVIAFALPGSWRAAFQYITIGDKINAVNTNFSLGVKMSF